MKIVQVHNFYQQAGGEDHVVKAEKVLLEKYGHEVISYHEHNAEINHYSNLQKAKLLYQLDFNPKSYNKCLTFLKEHQPDICHVHNTFHIISPAIFKACKALGIPVVQTLHNYRSICVNGMLTKHDSPCEDCLGQSAYRSLKSKCYRDSYIQTYAVARMIEKSKKSQPYHKDVDAFICLTDFAKERFQKQGIPEDKLYLKPNFVVPKLSPKTESEPYVIFVGRLDRIKGAHLLAHIADRIDIPLFVVGDGPLRSDLETQANITVFGQISHDETIKLIKNATLLLQPSVVYEGMPLTLIEAFAHHTPVVASNLGAMATMISHGLNGLLFNPGHPDDAIDKINQLITDHMMQQQLADEGHKAYMELYHSEPNYKLLMNIYESIQS